MVTLANSVLFQCTPFFSVCFILCAMLEQISNDNDVDDDDDDDDDIDWF